MSYCERVTGMNGLDLIYFLGIGIFVALLCCVHLLRMILKYVRLMFYNEPAPEDVSPAKLSKIKLEQ